MEKAGFVIKDNWAMIPDFSLGYITSDDNYQLEIKVAGIDTWRVVNVKYLHQLQNLVHSLTGKELEISL